jgi:predicted small lipoprotein YifL
MMTYTNFYQNLCSKFLPLVMLVGLIAFASLLSGCGQRAPLEKPDGYIEDSRQY